MSQRLANKVAVITGGNSGIGLATAELFAAEGAQVFITGRRQEELDAAVKAIGSRAIGVRGDVANLADLDRLFAEVKAKAGRVDVLFANAGVFEFTPFESVTEAQYDRMFNINVKGLLFTVQKALPLMSAGGSIILNASIVASKGIANGTVYSATKAAVRSLARTLTTDLKGRGIRVNAISPGPIETPGVNHLGATKEEVEATKAQLTSQVPLGRMGRADELAKGVLYLASDDSTFVTGIELFVDGGTAQV